MNPNKKTVFVFLLALSVILILSAIFYLDYLRLVNDILSESVHGFSFVRPRISTLNLTTDGNLIVEFLNLWPGTITITNISAYNRDSGICTISENLPLTVSMGNTFMVNAIYCAPSKKPPRRGERFYIEMTIEYIIGEKYIVSEGKYSLHRELGGLEGSYI